MPDGNPNRTIYADMLRRRIALERYSKSQTKKILRFVNQVRSDLAGKIAQLRADGASQLTIAQQERLLATFNELHIDIYAKMRREIEKDFSLFAQTQAEFDARAIRAVATTATVNEVSASAAWAIAKARPMNGRFLNEWFDQLRESHRIRLNQALRISFAEGESLGNAVKRIRVITQQNANGAKAFVRTANTHIAAAVQEETYKQNADLIEQYEWRSVLDSRTTPICAKRDGEVYEVGKGPIPPAHIGCRSVTVPILKGFERAERETYDQWLKRQPADVQDDVLGPARARLYRQGKVTVDGFVDNTGRTKTLEELAG